MATTDDRPRLFRRVWVPGVQYAGETAEQMIEREARWRAEDAAADAEERRIAEARARPVWVD